MSDNDTTDHFDVMFTGSGFSYRPFSAYGNKVLLAQNQEYSKVGIGVSSSGSVGSLLTLEGTSSAAGRVVRVMDKGQNHIVMSVDYDANTDGIVRILSGSNGQDGIQLSSNDVSFFSKNVGLGDFTPEARLSVRSSASAASRIFEVQNNTGNLLAMVENNATQTGGIFKLNNSAGNQKVKLNSEDNVSMFIGVGTGTPNLGIGTASPSADIHLKKTGSVEVQFESDEVGGTVYTRYLNDAISWRLGVQSNDRFALYDSTNAITHLIAENNSLRPLIGIGTTDPLNAVVLDVAGPMRVSGSYVTPFKTISTAQDYNFSANFQGGFLILNGTGSSGDGYDGNGFINISRSLIILNDTTNGGVTYGTCDITDWVDNAQIGQQLEIVIVGDGTDTQTQNGIQLQYFAGAGARVPGSTCVINGGHTKTLGTAFTYSSSVYNAPSKYVGGSLKLLKANDAGTSANQIKAWGTAMMTSGSVARAIELG